MIETLAPAQPDVSRPERVAPVWHTVLMVLLFLFLPLLRFYTGGWFPVVHRSDVPFLYILALMMQWILFALMWVGLLIRGTELKSLIGRVWKTKRDFLRDGGWALLFFIASVALTLALHFAYGALERTPDRFPPQNMLELLAILPGMISAGICEEIFFRGYLQKQIHSLGGNIWYAILVQAAIFSLAHGYDQTTAGYVDKFLYGAGAGLLANWRKSLLPGIISHSFQDAFVAIAVVVL
jgi:uncharacterized protein